MCSLLCWMIPLTFTFNVMDVTNRFWPGTILMCLSMKKVISIVDTAPLNEGVDILL